MNEGKHLREAADAVSGDALDGAMGLAFGSHEDDDGPHDDSGQSVGRYKLLEKIGEGGFGVVYMAEQQEPIRRRVALKIIKLGMDTKQVVARFEAERQALAMMDHENIASVLDAGATDTGRPFFVMELVRGVAITAYCDRNKLSTGERLQLFVSVCGAVQHAHQKGIIHRDLKPTNVMVTLRDGVPVPKVIDFGVAKATQSRLTDKTMFTRYGQFIGTPAYMSPEQVEMSEFDVDTRSDVYSLGVLLYELLTGSTPISHDKLRDAKYSEMQRMICDEEPPKPSSRLSQSGEAAATISRQRSTEPKTLNSILRGDLDWIVMKALEKDRTRRYATANGLAADVTRYLNQLPVEASPASAVYRLSKFAKKYRVWLTAAVAFALLLLSGTIISSWLAIRALNAEDSALFNERLARRHLDQERITKQEMQRQRDRAEQLGIELKSQLAATDREMERSRHLLYVAHMNLIQQELRFGNDARVIDLLNRHRPLADERDLRGFEWYYVWGLCHRNPWNWRHYVAIESIAYGDDGKHVITGCSDGSLQVWDAATGNILNAVLGHESIVFDVDIAPDGTTVLSGSFDGSAKLWSLESGRLIPQGWSYQHFGSVNCVAFSPDGEHLVSGSSTGQINLRNMRKGVDRQLEPVQGRVWSLAFSHDSSTLASADERAHVVIRDVETLTIEKTIDTGLHQIVAMAFSPTNGTLALGNSQGAVELWNDQTGKRQLGTHAGAVTDLAFSVDGKMLASCADDSVICLWDVERESRADVLRGHSARVHSIAFSPDRAHLVSASEDHTARMWDLTRGQSSIRLDAHEDSVGSIAFSPTEPNIVSAGLDGAVKLWDVRRGVVASTLPSYGGPVHCVAISPNGGTIAYAGGTVDQPADLLFFDMRNQSVRRTPKLHMRQVLSLAFSPDGSLASGDDDGVIHFWDVASGRLVDTLDNDTQAIVSLAFSNDGQLLASSSFHQNEITLWDVASRAIHTTLEGHQDWITAVAFSPDGTHLASGSIDKSVRIWDVATGNQLWKMVGHSLRVRSVAFSPDGATLASIAADEQLKLWDVTTGQEKASLSCQPKIEGVALAFSPDGRMLASADNRSVLVYRAATDQDFFLEDPPEVPQNRNPPADSDEIKFPITLATDPFFHRHPEVTHRTSHWQVRRADSGYTVPVVNYESSRDLTSMSIRHGLLSPATTYFWRVAFTASNHRKTSFGRETPFTTAQFAREVVHFDLTPHFNRDIIKDPGDEANDALDNSPGSHLVVEGFDGQRIDNPRVHGLPMDARLDVHKLGDYHEPNAIQTSLRDENKLPIRISVPPGAYELVRFLVVGGNGNSDMPVRFEYADGTMQREIILCDDWFHDVGENRYGLLRSGLLPRINEMDRFHENEFRDENGAAVFEYVVAVDPARELTAFVLEIDKARYVDTALYPLHARARFNLLAATGIKFDP